MIPFFIMVWGAITYMHNGYQAAEANARVVHETAWAEAMAYCGGRTPEPDDKTRLHVVNASVPTLTPMEGPVRGNLTMPSAIVAFEKLSGLRLEEVEVERKDVLDKPFVLGGGKAQVEFDMTLMCREEPEGDEPDLRVMTLEAWGIYGMGP